MKVGKVRVEPKTISIVAVTPVTPPVGQRFPDKVTFFLVLRHATRPNLRHDWWHNSSSWSVVARISPV